MIAAVLIGHLVGDWIVQTDYQARTKVMGWPEGFIAMMEHMNSYHLTLLASIFLFGGLDIGNDWGDYWRALILISVSFLTHAFIDRRWPVVRLMRLTQSQDFSEQMWGVMVVDQVLHISILLALVAILF
jgi:hypothetical protein